MPIAMEAVKRKWTALAQKAKGMASFLRGSRELVAVDPGSYAVKCCYFKEEGGILAVKAWGYLPYDLKPEASPEERKAEAIKSLKAFLAQKGLKIVEAATSLSGNSVIVRYVKFPQMTKAELSAMIATEAEPFIPFDINEVQLGFHVLGEVSEEGQKKMETVLVAAKKDLVSQRLEILQGAGLAPTIIDVDSFALENVDELVRDPKQAEGATLYLNIGHMVTNLSIVDAGVTRVVRDIFVSGITLTKAVMKALAVDFAKAEELKHQYGILVDPSEKEGILQAGQKDALLVSQTVAGVIKDLVGEVHRSVDFYLSQGPERSIGRIVLSGGSARLKNIDQHLAAELKVPVSLLNPFAFLKQPPADLPAELLPSFGVAVGLALRRNNDWV
ncbi:MAG: type IV pilus assembly protein PilM [Elusimicrobia bacterium]|nr:type IV pilus assembly protein PilM [Elusimicrobiota bacterium]